MTSKQDWKQYGATTVVQLGLRGEVGKEYSFVKCHKCEKEPTFSPNVKGWRERSPGHQDCSSIVCWRTVRFIRTIVIRNISAPRRRRTSTSNGAKDLSRMTSLSSNSPSVITMTYKNKPWPSWNTGYKHTYWNQQSLIRQIGACR